MSTKDLERLLLRPNEAATTLGVSRAKVYELIREGVIPTVYVGQRARIPTAALRRWIEERASTGRSTNSDDATRRRAGVPVSASGLIE